MKRHTGAVISLLAVLSLNLYFRLYPVIFPQFKQEAARIVEQRIRQEVANEINQKFPTFSDYSRAQLFTQRLAQYRLDRRKLIRQQEAEEFDKLKDRFQDKHGHTYLMELDCWHWGRYVENIERHGHIGDVVKNNKQYDTLMLFPQGEEIPHDTFFYYLSWFCYKVFSLFKPVDLDSFLFYLPLFFIAVYITVLYCFCYRYLGNTVALIACIFAGLAPIFIPRSCAGWFDRDILGLLFPLLIVWTYLAAYHTVSWRRMLLWSGLAGFWMGLFAFTWVGWPFILTIIVAFEGIYIANLIAEAVQYKDDIRLQLFKHVVVPVIFLAAGCIWIVIFCGTEPIYSLYIRFKEAVFLNQVTAFSIWPNVLSTVGELKAVDYIGIARVVGGIFFFLCSLISMLVIFLKIKEHNPRQRDMAVMFVVWFMVMFFFSSKGVRFTMFLSIPLGIYLAWGIDRLFWFVSRKPYRFITVPAVTVFALSVVLSSIFNADKTAVNCLPLMEDYWYRTLTTIRDYTPQDSVINSWWDFGDWFKAVAHRAVIFDGQTQNTPQAYWMARILLTDSEQEAVGILRMLNNGGNSAFTVIDNHVKDPFLSLSLLRKLIMMGPAEGKALLASRLPGDAANKVAGLLYDKPKQKAYFIVESSMLGKMPAISFLGNWDFTKIYLHQALHTKPKGAVLKDLMGFGLDKDRANDLYDEALSLPSREYISWISQRWFLPSMAVQMKSDEDMVLFNNGLIYNPHKKTLYSYSGFESRYRVPQSLFFLENNTLQELIYKNATLTESALLLENNDEYKLILLSEPLGRSMFVRLFFLQGKGLGHFKPFSSEESDGNRIAVYEVLWD